MTAAEQNRIVETLTEQIWGRLAGSGAGAGGTSRCGGGQANSAAHACTCGGSGSPNYSPCDIPTMVEHGACRVSVTQPASIDPATSSLIDHTLLKADATREEVAKICDEAIQFSFASVCVNPCWVPLVSAELTGSASKVCTVIGFPLELV